MTRQQQFAARLKKLIAEARALPEDTARRVISLLEVSRQEIVARLASAPSGSFSEYQLRAILDAAERSLREFRSRATGAIQAGQDKAFGLGVEIVDAPLRDFGLHVPLAGLAREQLVVAQGYSADLVRGLAGDTRTKLNGILRRAALGTSEGGLPGIIKQVGAAIDGKTPSLFSAAGARATSITRTEVLRVASVSTEARLQSWTEKVPEMRKGWQHSPQDHPRLRHRLMNGQTVAMDEKFVVPESGIELSYPRDPEAPASETVNCACVLVPVVPAAALRRAA